MRIEMSTGIYTSPSVDQKLVDQFENEGFMVLPQLIPMERVEDLRAVIDTEIDKANEEMDRQGVDTLGISHRNSRYFLGHAHDRHQAAREHCFSSEMEAICRATLGEQAQLFLDQFVVKYPMRHGRPGMKFGWHQDSGYIPHCRPYYLSCWTALDDMSIENGTVRILPYSRSGGRVAKEHLQEEGSNDMVGYHGSDPGDPAIVPAGSVVVFSSYTLHCSGENLSDRPRRAYLTQYSKSPIMNKDGSGLEIRAEPFYG